MKIKLLDKKPVGEDMGFREDKRIRTAAGYLLRLFAGFLLVQVRIFGSCSPFALGFVGACGGGIGGVCAAVGTMLGASIGGFEQAIRYSASALLIYSASFVFRDIKAAAKRRLAPLMSCLMAACVSLVYINYGGWNGENIAVYLADVILVYGSCRVYSAAVERKNGAGRYIGIAAFAMSLVMATSRVMIMDTISLGRFAAACGVLAIGYSAGIGVGSAAGVVLGMALDLAVGGRGAMAMIFGFAGMFSGFYGKKGRLAAAIAYVLANAVTAFWVAEGNVRMGLLYEAFAASVIFMLPPESIFSVFSIRGSSRAYFGAEREKEYFLDRAEQASRAFADIYEILVSTVEAGRNDNDISTVFDVAAEQVCRMCKKRERCWGADYERTKSALNDASAAMNIRGSSRVEDLPQHFRDSCDNVKAFIAASNEEMKALIRRRQMKNRINEDRSLLYNQFRDMSGLLEEIGCSCCGGGREERKTEERIGEYLEGIGASARCGVFRDRNSRLHIDIIGENLSAVTAGADWLEALSAAAGIKLCSAPERDSGILHLYEAEPLKASVGIAAVEREGSRQNGDMATWFKTSDGILYLIISDGMGSGTEAAADSKTAVDIAGKLLKAGVSPQLVMSIMNCAMLLKNEKSLGCASVDLMAINLFTGETHMYKYGAAPTYVRRGGKVEAVKGESFAAGLENGSPDVTRIRLNAKSAAVIVSDGADNPELIENALMKFDCEGKDGVRGLAADILEKAAAQYGRRDDMTVLAVSVEKRA